MQTKSNVIVEKLEVLLEVKNRKDPELDSLSIDY